MFAIGSRKDRVRNGRYPGSEGTSRQGVSVLLWVLDVVGYQLLAGALGLTVTLVLLDSGSGFVRDHPPLAWRLAGGAVGPLAALSFLCLILFTHAPLWVSMALVLPFSLLALIYSWAWFRRYGAERRRLRGREAMIVGLITLVFVSLTQTTSELESSLAMAAFAGSAALFGGLGLNFLVALMARRQEEVTVEANPYGMLARVTATGLGITLMALLETGYRHLAGTSEVASLSLLLWAAFSLLVPLLMVAAGHKLFPRFQSPIWTVAMASVVIGQVTLQMTLA